VIESWVVVFWGGVFTLAVWALWVTSPERKDCGCRRCSEYCDCKCHHGEIDHVADAGRETA
jgi:hypothetical protein